MTDSQRQRRRVVIRGAVQGVGFRPFVYRLATELRLQGNVRNSALGVIVEVQGDPVRIEDFLLRLASEKPRLSSIHSMETVSLDPAPFTSFEIQESSAGEKTALVLPDIATCSDCLREVMDSTDRRHRYPFTNCTNCGPRYSIIEALPYDRPNTTMRVFQMCARCLSEYKDPHNRRFHAQPNACPACGPQLELWDGKGGGISRQEQALLEAAGAILEGRIVAVKGLGGFHLMADARNEAAVDRLRRRKDREEKPFALMFPTLQAIRACCHVNEVEQRLLTAPESPIVLLRRRETPRQAPALPPEIAPSVAPRNPYLGIMLPYTPLHHLLMSQLGIPVVATSGNLSDEPICTDEIEALSRLAGIAELFLVHDRPISRHVDDSILCVMMGRELVLRRARGYAPLPILIADPVPVTLAVGAHLKNTVAASMGRNVFVSQHIGDLETAQAYRAFEKVIDSFSRLYELAPEAVACDAHPDYLSTQYAAKSGLPVVRVQHHYAHVLSCMAENELEAPLLGVGWDGTGYGLDGTVWGGEFLRLSGDSFRRFAHFRPFPLPGGEKAVREPRRAALGLLYEWCGEDVFSRPGLVPLTSFSNSEVRVLESMLNKKINTPQTSSAGRLFDAVASITGLRQKTRFEGQAAMELEFALDGVNTDAAYEFEVSEPQISPSPLPLIVDWAPMLEQLLDDVSRGLPMGEVSARFHNTLVEVIVAVAHRADQRRIVLSGGCFQNRYLTERAIHRLRNEGFVPYWHQRVPPNDGGISLGQTVAATLAGSWEKG